MQTQELNQIYKWAWIVLIILAVFLGVKTLGSLKDLRNTDPAYNSITVSGEGEVFAIPDLATFSFSVSAEASTVARAQELVTEKMDAVLKSLKDMGIEEKDIKTTNYSVWPKYSYEEIRCIAYPCPPSRQVQDGYSADHSVSVKVRDTDKAGQALTLAGQKGATNLSSISFTVDDMDKINEEARALAIEDAKEKAKALAKDLGVRIVRVASFNDGGYGSPVPMYAREGMGGVDMAAAQNKAPTLPTGENQVKVVVNITYEIR